MPYSLDEVNTVFFIFVSFRGYAEMVQRRLKAVGLVVDLHFHGTQPIMELLDDVARRGVLYAIVITSQHEVHRSVTVNILHGTPQGKDQKLLAGIKTHNGKGFIGKNKNTRCIQTIYKNWKGKEDSHELLFTVIKLKSVQIFTGIDKSFSLRTSAVHFILIVWLQLNDSQWKFNSPTIIIILPELTNVKACINKIYVCITFEH